MKLNAKKSNAMIFNFTQDYQFSTRLYIENNLLEIVQETKLLGTIISSDMTWYANTEMLVKRAYQRMIMLRKLYSFNVPDLHLHSLYTVNLGTELPGVAFLHF